MFALKLFVLVGILAIGSLGDANSVAAQFQALRKQIDTYGSSIDKYDGSYRTMVPLAINSIKMHQASRQTKRAIENTDSFAEDDVPALTEELGRVHGAMKNTLETASSKDQIADSNGFKQVAALMLMHFSNEQNATAEALKGKMPQNSHGLMEVALNEASQNFDTVLRRFR